MSNHERIFLGPECEPNRLWCQDQVFEDCDGQCGGDNHEPICYVREDIHKARVAELESRLQASVDAHNQIFEALRECEEKRNAQSLRLDSAIEIRCVPSEPKYRYSLSWRKGACVGETLAKALETMSHLIEGHEPEGIIEATKLGVVEKRDTKHCKHQNWQLDETGGRCIDCGAAI